MVTHGKLIEDYHAQHPFKFAAYTLHDRAGTLASHTIKAMVADLQKCCSKDNSPTAPWRFPLSFFPLPCSSLFLWQGVNLTFEGDDSLLQLLLIMSHK